MSKVFPWPVRLMVLLVASVATGLFVLNLGISETFGIPEVAAAVIYGCFAAASHFLPTWSFNQHARVEPVSAAYFALALVMPRAWIAPVIILSVIPWVILRLRRKPTWPVELTFNVSSYIIASVSARAVFVAVTDWLTSPTVALLAGAAIHLALEIGLVTTIVVLWRRIKIRQVDTLRIPFLSVSMITLVVGGVTVLLYQIDPLSLVMVFLPLAYLQHLLDRVQTQDGAFLDGKTGLYNYKYLDTRLPQEVERAKSTGLPLSVIFVDLDYLRDINNTHGHLAGDAAIKQVGHTLRSCIRENHFVARFGGEEYVMVLPLVSQEEAIRIADEARALVAGTPVEVGDLQFSVTGSFGVATVPVDAQTVRDLIHAADMAVYQAKSGGRNCVRVCAREGVETCAASR